MPPIPSKTKRGRVPPLWWKQSINEEDKEDIRQAVAVYCYENGISATEMQTQKDDFIAIIPTVARYIKKWNTVDADNFNY